MLVPETSALPLGDTPIVSTAVQIVSLLSRYLKYGEYLVSYYQNNVDKLTIKCYI